MFYFFFKYINKVIYFSRENVYSLKDLLGFFKELSRIEGNV